MTFHDGHEGRASGAARQPIRPMVQVDSTADASPDPPMDRDRVEALAERIKAARAEAHALGLDIARQLLDIALLEVRQQARRRRGLN